MDSTVLKNKFKDHASEILQAKNSTSKFRSTSYNHVADVIESKFPSGTVITLANVPDIPVTDYMRSRIVDVINGKQLESIKTAKKATDKSNRKLSITKPTTKPIQVKTKKQPNVKNRLLSRSRTKSLSPKLKASKNDETGDNSGSESDSESDNGPNSTLESKSRLVKELTMFMGIGNERALALIKDGLTHINQLHQKKWLAKLPEETRLFISLKPDTTIPRDDIALLEQELKAAQIPNMIIQFVGSYRRKKPTSSDIDIMLVSDAPDAIDIFLDVLNKVKGVKAYPYSKGNDKISFIVNVTSLLKDTTSLSKDKIYKIDAFRVNPVDYIPALLYTTGSKTFNITMRGIAKKKGYLLNQKGLFKKTDDKFTKIEGLTTEKDYFDKLEMKYLEPEERV